MRRETPSRDITDFVWPPIAIATLMSVVGKPIMIAGGLGLVAGLIPGVALPPVVGVDAVAWACLLVIVGLFLWAYGRVRARTRRLRVDRGAGVIAREIEKTRGHWVAEASVRLDDLAELELNEDDVEDRSTAFDVVAVQHNGDKVSLWPVVINKKAEGEAALAAVKAALHG
jgi:hypothetical protein